MSTIEFVKMWTCSQCGDPLGKKCVQCKKHPNRKPRIVEWYEFPKILRTCECASSVLIPCSRAGCTKTRWMNIKNTRGGLSRHETLFCSRQCNCIVQNLSKKTSVMVPCGWCAAPVKRKQSEIKALKNAYCRHDHYVMHMKKQHHEEKERARLVEKALAKMTSRSVSLQCEGACRGAITEHMNISRTMASCKPCGTTRSNSIAIR